MDEAGTPFCVTIDFDTLEGDGTVTLRDLNRELEWDLPDDKAATIAGLLLHDTRRIPESGQMFAFYGYRFEILRRQRNQITSIRVTPLRKPQTD